MSARRDVSLIFVKQPEPGRVKTRLGRSIGLEKAAWLYARLVSQVWQEIRRHEACEHWVLFEPASAREEIKNWLPNADRYVPQDEGDLGQRLGSAFAEAFAGIGGIGDRHPILRQKLVSVPNSPNSQDGTGRGVVAIGSDVPDLRASDLEQAFEALKSHDAVIGPADDGGYWLIGLSRPFPELFHGISWSTSTVAAETIDVLNRHRKTYTRLRTLRDIDEAADLHMFPDLLSMNGKERK